MTVHSNTSDVTVSIMALPSEVTSPAQQTKTEPVSATTARLVKIGADLRAIAASAETREQLISLLLELSIKQTQLLCAAWLQVPINGKLMIADSRYSNPAIDNMNIRSQLVDVAKTAVETRTTQIVSSKKVRGACIVSVPFYLDEATTAVFCGLVHDNSQNKSEGLLICQIVSTHYDLWRARDELTVKALEMRSTAAVLELVGKIQDSRTVRAASYVIANELKDLFRCEYVAVGLRKAKKRSCKLTAVSALSDFDTESKTTLLFRSVFDEAVMRGRYTVYPPRTNEQRNSTISHKKLARQMRCESAITIPVRNKTDEIIGAITLAGNRSLDRNPATRNLIHALEHPLGSSVEAVKYAEGGFLRKATRFLVSPRRTNLVWATWAIVVVTLGAMFLPVPYRVHCSCIAEPVLRRISVAPYEGLLENTFVEPGDVVTSGQLLARMDGREIRFERAGVEADKTRAIKKRDTHEAKKEIPDAIMADLERARLEAKIKLLEHRERNFEIVSPINGIVLSGSIDRRENYPVTLGESLFEIAPLHPLRVDLAIPSDEVMRIKEGQIVKFRFDGFGTQTVEGIVKRIRPSTTIRNDENVFIAEALLNNEDGAVRPGMEGNAKIYGAKRRLGWCIFHRPWERIVTAVGF